MLQIVASLTIVIDNTSYGYKAMVKHIKWRWCLYYSTRFIYDRQNIFIIQATDANQVSMVQALLPHHL